MAVLPACCALYAGIQEAPGEGEASSTAGHTVGKAPALWRSCRTSCLSRHTPIKLVLHMHGATKYTVCHLIRLFLPT